MCHPWNLAQGSSLSPRLGGLGIYLAKLSTSELLSMGVGLERKEQDRVLTHISQGDTRQEADRVLSSKCNE